MKNAIRLILIFILFLVIGCNTEEKKVEYGDNNGKYLTLLDTKIYYEEYGQGTPLILLEGGMGSIYDFAKCIPELSKHYRIIAPDTPGQGRSEMADSMSYELMAEYISKFIDLLKLDSAYVMGWSDGGNTALILGNKRPEKIKGIVASEPIICLKGTLPYKMIRRIGRPS